MGQNEIEFEKFLSELTPIAVPKVEFRLYYREDGSIICYTCDNLEGNYITIDAQTFAECRPDVKVIDGKIEIIKPMIVIHKMTESEYGIKCAVEDINIVVRDDYTGNTKKWEMKRDEFEYS
jgi:hypothetical protein